jgi:glycosyltransferase involved in cell wall biosynthesis
MAIQAMKRAGHEVAAVEALLKSPPKDDDLGIKLYTPSKEDDPLGTKMVREAYVEFKPDLVYMTCEPGTVTAFAMHLPQDAEVLAYSPIEGEPMSNRMWTSVMTNIDSFTCSAYGADVFKRTTGLSIPWVYHGVDHDTFQVTGLRDKTREHLKWQDKFIVMSVGQNVRRKQLPRLIEAMHILRYGYKRDDIYLYLHTVPFQNYWLEGWNLPEVIDFYRVGDRVMFHPAMGSFNSFVPERTDDPTYPGLVELYNAADLFVLPSQVEGFGLPIAEAMACGLPVAVTKYAAGWEVANPAGRGILPHDWEMHKSGTRYANVSPDEIAKVILKLARNPNELARMRERGLERVKDFQWSEFDEMLLSEIERIGKGGGKASSRTTEEIDSPPSEGTKDVRVRKAKAKGTRAKSEVLA